MEAGRALAEERGLNSIVARALLNMTGSFMGRDPRRGVRAGHSRPSLSRGASAFARSSRRRPGTRSSLRETSVSSIGPSPPETSCWVSTSRPATVTHSCAGSPQRDSCAVSRSTSSSAEHAEVLVDEARRPGGLELRRRDGVPAVPRRRLRRGVGALGEGGPDGDAERQQRPPTCARAATWDRDVPTTERLIAEFRRDWTQGRYAHARLAGAHRKLSLRSAVAATKRSSASRQRSRPCAKWGSKSMRSSADARHGADAWRNGSGRRPVAGRGSCDDRAIADAGPERPASRP